MIAAIGAAALLLAVAASVGPGGAGFAAGSAEAAVPPKHCGGLKVRGNRYVVKAHRTKCRFARRWTKKVLNGKGRPRGWSCRRYSKKQSRIAFVCRKPGKDFFAIRK